MKLFVIILLFGLTLIPLTIKDVSAKCIDSENCVDFVYFRSLKEQIQLNTVLPNIVCPNSEHSLVERPNGKLACITWETVQKTGWDVHYRFQVDLKDEFPVVKHDSTVFLVPFEITGATLDDMYHENQKLVVMVSLNDKNGVLSITLPQGLLDASLEYCDPRNENPPNAPFIVIMDGIEHENDEAINSRFQPALNIQLNENSYLIEIAATCFE